MYEHYSVPKLVVEVGILEATEVDLSKEIVVMTWKRYRNAPLVPVVKAYGTLAAFKC